MAAEGQLPTPLHDLTKADLAHTELILQGPKRAFVGLDVSVDFAPLHRANAGEPRLLPRDLSSLFGDSFLDPGYLRGR